MAIGWKDLEARQRRDVRLMAADELASRIDAGRVSVRFAASARDCNVEDIIELCARFGVEVSL